MVAGLPLQWTDLQTALEQEQKKTANVLNNIGLVYDKLGKKKKAQKYYKAAQGLN